MQHALACLVDPTGVEPSPPPLGPFPESLALTKAADVTLVSLPATPPAR
jgi:hypothetical protein